MRRATQVVDLGTMDSANVPGTALNMTSTSQQILPANPNRRLAVITNRSTTAMLSLSLGGTAVSGSGICLANAADATHPGGTLALDNYAGQINGIMSAADSTAGNVAVAEV